MFQAIYARFVPINEYSRLLQNRADIFINCTGIKSSLCCNFPLLVTFLVQCLSSQVGMTGLAPLILLGEASKNWHSPDGLFCFRRRPLSSKLDASCSKSKTSAIAEALPIYL